MAKKEILMVTAGFPAWLKEKLNAEFTAHDRIHEGDAKAFAAIAPRIEAIAANGESKVPRSLLEQLPNVKLVSVFGVGYDGVDAVAAKERGVMVTHTPDVLNDDVADLAIALMFAVARRIPQADRFVREGHWEKGPFPLASKVSGARLGLIGMGRIGQAIAKRGEAFGMSIAYHSRNANTQLPYRHHATPESLAAASDYLVVITPGGAATKGLVSRSVLEALGPTGYLVNVARGTVVDQDALIEALQQKKIAGAGLDVFVGEPKVPQALRELDNVVLTPHIGSATQATRQKMADLAWGNLEAHFAGKPLLTPVPECR